MEIVIRPPNYENGPWSASVFVGRLSATLYGHGKDRYEALDNLRNNLIDSMQEILKIVQETQDEMSKEEK
jgi:hypothetical protein